MNITKDTIKQFKECKSVYPIFIVVIASIFLWVGILYYRYKSDYVTKDPLNKTVFEWNWMEKCCSWWPISHFILFAILAFIFPNCHWMLFVSGVIWELVEVNLSKFNDQSQIIDIRVQYGKNWWAGSFKDVLFNTVGIIFGKFLRNLADSQQLFP